MTIGCSASARRDRRSHPDSPGLIRRGARPHVPDQFGPGPSGEDAEAPRRNLAMSDHLQRQAPGSADVRAPQRCPLPDHAGLSSLGAQMVRRRGTHDMSDIVSGEAVAALLQVIMINFVLSGDNAVVIGLATAGLPSEQRKRAIFVGILAATVLRIAFAGVATQLLQVLGLLLAGGILLLWVCWKMWRELRARSHDEAEAEDVDATTGRPLRHKTFRQAALQIVVADVSMSLDNVLAVAGAAREHPFILAFGLLLSIAMMAVAANLLGRLIEKYRWIAYLGLVVILYVAFDMIYRGTLEVTPAIGAVLPFFT